MKYRYNEIGKYLVCVDQSVTNAIRKLLLGFNDNNLNSLGVSRSVARSAVRLVAKEKLFPQRSNGCQTLPAFGHLGMNVHRGYKLFDFNTTRVTKVFAAGVSREGAEQEIAASREASAVSLAPRFIAADPRSAWFSEEYVRGTHATDLVAPNSSDYLRYYADVETCLLELLACKRPDVADALVHITGLADDNYRKHWRESGFAGSDVDRISSYIESLRSWLVTSLSGVRIQLIRTHGDFSLVNAISTGNRLRFIDWEGIGPGSLYSDIYNFVFAEHYYSRTSPDFISEVLSTIEKFRTAVLRTHPGLRDAATMNQTIVRRLYYLERIKLMAQRDVTLNLQRVIEKSIAMFNEFDRDVGDDPL